MAGVASLLLLASLVPAFATEEGQAGKAIKITGDAKCGKCALKETDKCQNVIQVAKRGKIVTYYLVENDVSKAFHENVCHEPKKATAIGTDKQVDGKHQFTATKISLVK